MLSYDFVAKASRSKYLLFLGYILGYIVTIKVIYHKPPSQSVIAHNMHIKERDVMIKHSLFPDGKIF